MIIFPNCKINLGLNIVKKRNDGYHNLQTIFYPIPFTDALEIIVAKEFSFTTTGLSIDTGSEKNLCVKAYQLLQPIYNLPPVHIHLHKAIPLGAGLGGGSADAAFTLLLLNKKFNLNLSSSKLIDFALQLGSDCPFFIINQPCYATGRGELLEPIELSLLKGKQLVIINPGIHVNTGWAFSQITPSKYPNSLQQTTLKPITEWKEFITNDFEAAVFNEHPSLPPIKQQLYDAGALFAGMTGSGSTIFGIFEKNTEFNFLWPEHYFQKIVQL